NSAPFSGAAYVLLRDPDRSQWQAHAYLKANVAGTRFLGTSVAIDGGRIFVGTGSSPGDAHVFTLD
ncbi:MAG: hypothetical protein OEY14_04780, partial [Myxococcales bacterium]|nr:hypothetical protein [Myxococcales bacterium]